MKKCTIFANDILVRAYLAFYCAMITVAVISWLIDSLLGTINTILVIFLIIIACCITERWCLLITFDHNGIWHKPLFKKSVYLDYSNYTKIQYGYYMHGNVLGSYKVHFFILTNRRLSDDELSNINLECPSKDLIKIRYNHRIYQKLMKILPEQMAHSIENIYNTYIEKSS